MDRLVKHILKEIHSISKLSWSNIIRFNPLLSEAVYHTQRAPPQVRPAKTFFKHIVKEILSLQMLNWSKYPLVQPFAIRSGMPYTTGAAPMSEGNRHTWRLSCIGAETLCPAGASSQLRTSLSVKRSISLSVTSQRLAITQGLQ